MTEKLLTEMRFIETDDGYRIEVKGDKENLKKMGFSHKGFGPGRFFGRGRGRFWGRGHGCGSAPWAWEWEEMTEEESSKSEGEEA